MSNSEWCKRWRKKNVAKFRELRRRSSARYFELHPETRIAIAQRHRARKRAGGSFTAKEWIALKKFYGNRCLCCGRSERALKKIKRILAVDHIVPLSKGGRNTIKNIQPLCHSLGQGSRGGCNNLKGAKYIDFRNWTQRPNGDAARLRTFQSSYRSAWYTRSFAIRESEIGNC